MSSTQFPLELLHPFSSEHFPSLGYFDELLLMFGLARACGHLSADPSMTFVFCNFTHEAPAHLTHKKPRANSGAEVRQRERTTPHEGEGLGG